MSEKLTKLRYVAFFEALMEVEDEGPMWHSLSAGLVTLRLVDTWLTRGGTEPGGDQWGIQAVRQQVERVPVTDPARAILEGVVAEVERPGPADPVRVVPRLMAYGRSLDFAGRWALASDLYELVLAYVDVNADIDLATGAQFRLAYCQRVLGRLDQAEHAYAAAGQLADMARDDVGILRSQVGVAKVALARGNHPAAERAMDAVIRRADGFLAGREHPSMREFRATALHDRAVVALEREQHERAIALLNEALPDTHSPSARDRVIADIASAFLSLGMRSAARDGFLVVAATASEQFSRWSATINLVRIAALDHHEPAFEQYRRQLATASLTPELEAYYHEATGVGYRTFGHLDRARASLEQAAAVAERHGFNRVVFIVERELAAVAAGARPEPRVDVPVPPVLGGAATTMRSLRESTLAGV